MATRLPVGPFRDQTFVAAASLAAYRYRQVKLASGEVNICGENEQAIGILQNAPAAGEQAVVRTFGESLCYVDASSAITEGCGIDSAASGVGVKNATDKAYIVGWAREGKDSGTGTIVVDVNPQTQSV